MESNVITETICPRNFPTEPISGNLMRDLGPRNHEFPRDCRAFAARNDYVFINRGGQNENQKCARSLAPLINAAKANYRRPEFRR